MEKAKENRWFLHPFHLLMAWLIVEIFFPILLTVERKWYHYMLVILWVLVLWLMDFVLRKTMRVWWKIWVVEFVFLLMVFCAWAMLLK